MNEAGSISEGIQLEVFSSTTGELMAAASDGRWESETMMQRKCVAHSNRRFLGVIMCEAFSFSGEDKLTPCSVSV